MHVVGTNGKSTTTRMVEELLLAGGVRAGAYLSPHVRSWAERLRVAGVEADLEAALHVVRPPAERTRGDAVRGADRGRLRCVPGRRRGGGGDRSRSRGRHDATNVLDATRVVVLTNVSLEHTDVLGTTREAIAAEKLAVVQPGCTVVVGEPEWEGPARVAGAGEVIVEPGGSRALALAAARAFLGREPDASALEGCRWRGGWSGGRARSVTGRTTPRASGGSWSICPAPTIRSWHRSSPTRTWTECSRGSQARGRRFAACRSSSPRALPPSELGDRARRLFDVVEVRDDPHDALALAHALGEPVLVTGSLYLLTDLEAGPEARP